VKLFDEGESMWDALRGRPLPEKSMPDMDNVESLDDLVKYVREWSQAEEGEQGQPRHRSEVEAETR